jgi:hypothetical protein
MMFHHGMFALVRIGIQADIAPFVSLQLLLNGVPERRDATTNNLVSIRYYQGFS